MAARGFTLVEVLVAILLTALILPLSLEAIGLGGRAAAAAHRRELAERVARSRLAELVATGGWSAAATSGDCDPARDGDEAAGLRWRLEVTAWGDGAVAVSRLALTVAADPDDPASGATVTTLAAAPASAP